MARPERITDMATLRAKIAQGCRDAADVYRASGLPGAAELANRLDDDALRNDALAKASQA